MLPILFHHFNRIYFKVGYFPGFCMFTFPFFINVTNFFHHFNRIYFIFLFGSFVQFLLQYSLLIVMHIIIRVFQWYMEVQYLSIPIAYLKIIMQGCQIFIYVMHATRIPKLVCKVANFFSPLEQNLSHFLILLACLVFACLNYYLYPVIQYIALVSGSLGIVSEY